MSEDILLQSKHEYGDDSIIHLDDVEHIRKRPGMYIGRRGNGGDPTDGIYVLTKEVIDNSVDEFRGGYGKKIDVTIEDGTVTVRDYGRGIPFKTMIMAVSRLNSGAKYNDKSYKKSVGLNGVGLKAVNALSSYFKVQSFRDGATSWATFSKGEITGEGEEATAERNGTQIIFTPDNEIFEGYAFNEEYVVEMVKNYAYLNVGLTVNYNKETYKSADGLLDLLNDNIDEEPLYPPIHITGEDIEIVMTHGNKYGENIHSFVNGQNTILGGTHVAAFREAIGKTLKDFYKKDFTPADARQSIVGAIAISMDEPEFEAQTKVQLGSKVVNKEGLTMQKFVGDFVSRELDNYLHQHKDVADMLLAKILASEKERKAVQGLRKETKERLK